jgi:superfamily II DNA/RNA helicase
VKFLVLDEADRLFCKGFERCVSQLGARGWYGCGGLRQCSSCHLSDLAKIMGAIKGGRQTMLFSATMTTSLEELKALTMTKPLLFDLTKERALPSALQQQYIFMPAQVRASGCTSRRSTWVAG